MIESIFNLIIIVNHYFQVKKYMHRTKDKISEKFATDRNLIYLFKLTFTQNLYSIQRIHISAEFKITL